MRTITEIELKKIITLHRLCFSGGVRVEIGDVDLRGYSYAEIMKLMEDINYTEEKNSC